MSAFTVKTSQFEGPLELLLSLILERKLFINDVSLAAVTDDYLRYLAEHRSNHLPQTAQFLVVASTLLLIKSKSRLPSLVLTDEETADIADLERRLQLYKRMRELSRHVENLFGKRILFSRVIAHEKPIFVAPPSLAKTDLSYIIAELIRHLPQKEILPKVLVQKVLSLEEMIDRLSTRMAEGMRTSFREFAGGKAAAKAHVIVSFLALLELIKRGIVTAIQDQSFSDITIESESVHTPRYG